MKIAAISPILAEIAAIIFLKKLCLCRDSMESFTMTKRLIYTSKRQPLNCFVQFDPAILIIRNLAIKEL